MSFLIVLFFLLFFVAIIVAVIRRSEPVMYNDFDDEEVTHTTVTTTTTTTEQPAPLVATVGVINSYQKSGSAQWYVIDPVDKEETAVDANDDYYRDAGGKIWDLQ